MKFIIRVHLTRSYKNTVIPQSDCTGCGLCSYVCPAKCITMREGKLGHLFPHINNKICIHCNLCVKTCPSIKHIALQYPLSSYAAWAKDENEYISSTSGGAASVFSREIIKRDGVVYGCTMTYNSIVKHIRVDNEESLIELKGSKYVQSNLTDIFHSLKEDVRTGLPVLFIGTPCQVAAIKSLFKSEPVNLFLIDIICHGVPSLHLFHKYLRKKFGKFIFDSISFRQGNKLNLILVDKGREIYNAPFRDDLYYKLFMSGYTYRDSCHHCKYAQPNRVSDVTIGDFWGLGKMGGCDIPVHNNGISVILPITNKGMSLFHSVKEKLNIYERPIEEAIEGNAQLKTPSFAGKRIKRFQIFAPVWGINMAYKLAHFDNYLKKFVK